VNLYARSGAEQEESMVNRRSLAIALAALLCFVAGSARADTATSPAPASGDGMFVQV